MNKELLKNLQQSLVNIASELSQVRSLSARDESLVNLNIGRLQGLAQGIDFFLNTQNEDPKVYGFKLQEASEEDFDEEENKKNT